MVKKFFRRKLRATQRWARRHNLKLSIAAIVLVIGAMAYTGYMQDRRFTVDPKTYQPLLDLIAKAESRGNYNAYFGNAGNTAIKFTEMTIAEVQTWQQEFVRQGNASSAVGRYQFIDTTLRGLVQQLGIDPRQKFDQSTQDRFAIALIERRGSEAYINDELTREQFAANLAKEWAGLPKVLGDKPEESFYASDGLNQSRSTVTEVLQAIDPITPTR